MSDTSQGAGWWQASDRKWYPPEQFPDELEMPPEVAEALASKESEPAPAVEPSMPPTSPVTDPTVEAPSDGPGGPPTESIDTPPLTADPAERPTSTFAAPSIGDPTTAVPSAPPTGWGDSTSVYAPPAPAEAQYAAPPPAEGSNVPAAVLALIAAALAIVGSFLEWAKPAQEGDVVLPPGIANITVPSFDGLDSNGVGTLVCGAIMAIVAGVLLAKVRHVVLMVALIVVGVVTAGLFLYSFIDITGLDIKINGTKVEGIGFDPGIGLWVVLGGGVLSIVAGLLVKRR